MHPTRWSCQTGELCPAIVQHRMWEILKLHMGCEKSSSKFYYIARKDQTDTYNYLLFTVILLYPRVTKPDVFNIIYTHGKGLTDTVQLFLAPQMLSFPASHFLGFSITVPRMTDLVVC